MDTYKPMTPERLEELRELAAKTQSSAGMEVLTALEAAQQEIADLKRGGVVSARDLDGLWRIVEREREWRLQESECGGGEIRESVGRLRREWDEATSSLRTIPADRELMRLVDELIRWHGLRPLDKRPDHAAALVGAIKAIRAQPTQELAP